jgi:hypothetical protein
LPQDASQRAHLDLNKFAIQKLRPAPLMRCDYVMAFKKLPQRRRCALIEKYLHSGCFKRTARRVFKNGTGLFGRNARKPLNKIVQ